jgi:hypothetical protein
MNVSCGQDRRKQETLYRVHVQMNTACVESEMMCAKVRDERAQDKRKGECSEIRSMYVCFDNKGIGVGCVCCGERENNVVRDDVSPTDGVTKRRSWESGRCGVKANLRQKSTSLGP